MKISAIATASGLQIVFLAILSLVLAKILPVDAFGVTRTVTAYIVVLTMMGHFCLHDAVAAYVAGAKVVEEKISYVVNGSYQVVLISLVVTLVAELVVYFGGIWEGDLKKALFLAILFLPIVSLTIVYTSLLQAIGSYKKFTVSLILGGIIPFVFIAPPAWQWGLNGWIWGRNVASIMLLVFTFYLVKHWFQVKKMDKQVSWKLLAFAKIQFISGILSMLMQSADIIALERLSGHMSQVAVYGLAALFAKSVMFFPGAIGRVYFKEIAESSTDSTKVWGLVNHLLIATIMLCILMAVIIYIAVPIIINVLYHDRYSDSIPVLKIMCIGITFSGLWAALSVVNTAMKQPRIAVVISITGVVVSFILLGALVPKFGAVGAAWAMNGGYFSGSLMGMWLLFQIKRRSMTGTIE